MPVKVYPTIEEFGNFERGIRRLGFREIQRQEFRNDFLRLGLVAPRSRHGREVGYSFHANNLTVRVWTTWLREEETIREEDSGWVLISQDDEARYFCHPLHRTQNYLESLTTHARITQSRVINRPVCPHCYEYMNITRGKGLGSRYWRCDFPDLHEDWNYHIQGWDYGLAEEDLRFVMAERRRRRKYRDDLKRRGIEVVPAIFTRKSWEQMRILKAAG